MRRRLPVVTGLLVAVLALGVGIGAMLQPRESLVSPSPPPTPTAGVVVTAVLQAAAAGTLPSPTSAATPVPITTPTLVAREQQAPQPVAPLRLADGSVPPPYQANPAREAAIRATLEASGPIPTPIRGTPEPSASQADLDRALAAKLPTQPRQTDEERFNASKGTKIRVAGKELQLPPDVGVFERGFLIHGVWPVRNAQGTPQPGLAPERQVVVLRRGEALAWIGESSGTLQSVTTPPGQEGAFDWLKEALRDG